MDCRPVRTRDGTGERHGRGGTSLRQGSRIVERLTNYAQRLI